MYETRVQSDDTHIKNQAFLRKFIMTHHDCEVFMRHLDLKSLREDGDIVWEMPCDWEFNVMKPDGQCEKVVWARRKKLYVCFLDIGLTADRDMHRLHLRTDPNRKEKRKRAADLATCLQESLVRCAAHVRLLDYDRDSLDRTAKNSAQGYYLHAWACCHSVRKEYLWKSKKRTQTSDNHQWKADDWAQDSGWHRRKKTCP